LKYITKENNKAVKAITSGELEIRSRKDYLREKKRKKD